VGRCVANFADLPINIHQQGQAPVIKCLRQRSLHKQTPFGRGKHVSLLCRSLQRVSSAISQLCKCGSTSSISWDLTCSRATTCWVVLALISSFLRIALCKTQADASSYTSLP
jgi:hypothetical protein